MPTSTKNLKERIEEVLKRMSFGVITNRESHPPRTAEEPISLATDAITSLLSSELSLAIKGLREAIEDAETIRKYFGHGDCSMPHTYDILMAFDSKAKEILGVLTHED